MFNYQKASNCLKVFIVLGGCQAFAATFKSDFWTAKFSEFLWAKLVIGAGDAILPLTNVSAPSSNWAEI